MEGQLILSSEARAHVITHVRAAFPDEAVGMLGGDAAGRVVEVFPLPNLSGPGGFLADPRAQYEAERELQRRRMALLAVYHSHPGGTPTLSPLDRQLARHVSAAQLVIAVGGPPLYAIQMRAYHRDTQDPIVVVTS
jgi:[CysO sulfur-carrier protein]-S-L-cysteine hydrolase